MSVGGAEVGLDSESLLPGGRYYWYVYAEDEAGYPVGSSDGRSQIGSFTVQFTPPTLTYPTGGEEIITLPDGTEMPSVKLEMPAVLTNVWLGPDGRVVKAEVPTERLEIRLGETETP